MILQYFAKADDITAKLSAYRPSYTTKTALACLAAITLGTAAKAATLDDMADQVPEQGNEPELVDSKSSSTPTFEETTGELDDKTKEYYNILKIKDELIGLLDYQVKTNTVAETNNTVLIDLTLSEVPQDYEFTLGDLELVNNFQQEHTARHHYLRYPANNPRLYLKYFERILNLTEPKETCPCSKDRENHRRKKPYQEEVDKLEQAKEVAAKLLPEYIAGLEQLTDRWSSFLKNIRKLQEIDIDKYSTPEEIAAFCEQLENLRHPFNHDESPEQKAIAELLPSQIGAILDYSKRLKEIDTHTPP